MRKTLLIAALACLLFRSYLLFRLFLYFWVMLVSYLQMQQEKRIILNELLRFNILLMALAIGAVLLDSLLIKNGFPFFSNGSVNHLHTIFSSIGYWLVIGSVSLVAISWVHSKRTV